MTKIELANRLAALVPKANANASELVDVRARLQEEQQSVPSEIEQHILSLEASFASTAKVPETPAEPPPAVPVLTDVPTQFEDTQPAPVTIGT